ncbi:hypothetical protein [Bradyrhizobium sp. BRP56]|uniref:hypothetical protein n=1 Tax=Bradyrhizobium sp. BRP56 TaxID=2793819 RepID=UPI001CD660EF|nr:hypothetical protein [Bradyrhizobium sp. BRP56]
MPVCTVACAVFRLGLPKKVEKSPFGANGVVGLKRVAPPGSPCEGLPRSAVRSSLKVLVAQFDFGVVVGLQGYRWIDAVALEMIEITEGVGALVEHVEPCRDVVVDRLSGIEADAAIAPRAGLRRRLVDAVAVGLLQRAVEQAAAGAAAEG